MIWLSASLLHPYTALAALRSAVLPERSFYGSGLAGIAILNVSVAVAADHAAQAPAADVAAHCAAPSLQFRVNDAF